MQGSAAQPGQGPDEQERYAVQPPLPGPADETSAPMTIIPGPAAQDTPTWAPPPATSGETRPAAYRPEVAATAQASITSVMSDTQRSGRWEVPPVLTVNACMSEVQLDLREAVLASPVVEIRTRALMSSLKLVVPPGVQVEWAGGTSIMSEEKAAPGHADPEMWKLRIVHNGLMDSVKVQVLAVGEQPPKWWKKIKG